MTHVKMDRSMQKLLRDFVRTHFAANVGGATFYYHGPGIKFWGIGYKRGELHKVFLAITKKLKKVLPGVANVVHVSGGFTDKHGGPASLYIRLNDAPDLVVYGEHAVQAERRRFDRPPFQAVIKQPLPFVQVPRQELIDLRNKLNKLLGE